MRINAIDESMKIREAFPSFTALLKYCRPNAGDAIVYAVDAGMPTEPNLVMKASLFDGENPIGEIIEFVISKEWVLENVALILQKSELEIG